MREFREYYEDLENSVPLDEDVFTAILGGVLGLPVALATSWGAAWATKKYLGFNKKLFKGIAQNTKAVRKLFSRDKKITPEKIEKTTDKIEAAPEVRKAVREIEKLEDKYQLELGEIYTAIENKDIDTAENLYRELSVNVQENPEARVAIINVILREYKEPPVYTVSPGNETYQAIKRLFGQKVARAMEELAKKGFGDYYERVIKEK